MKECVWENHKRLIITLPNIQVLVIDEKGISKMKDTTVKNLKQLLNVANFSQYVKIHWIFGENDILK